MNELETILCDLLRCDRSGLYLDQRSRRPLTAHQFARLSRVLKERVNGEPLQYLTGQQEFMGLLFKVSPDVLVPRPETEILVERAIERLGAFGGGRLLRILDMGTGCGNIAISLAKFLKNVCVDAVDISLAALEVARANARLNHVEGRIVFRQGDLFNSFDRQHDRFDFIVSNPPYISRECYAYLPRDVRREPKGALIAGKNGLFFYYAIEENARVFLRSHGMVFLEIGDGQADGVSEIFSDLSVWKGVSWIKDYCGVERVVIVEKI